ncbi:hypothetical protein [Roseibium sp. LAB1]
MKIANIAKIASLLVLLNTEANSQEKLPSPQNEKATEFYWNSDSAADAIESILKNDVIAPTKNNTPPSMAIVWSGSAKNYGFLKDGDNPLGTYRIIPNSAEVLFTYCSDNQREKISKDRVEDTQETCKSIPGEPPRSITVSYSTKWKFEQANSAFYVIDEEDPMAEPFYVPCSETPWSLLEAARLAGSGKTALIGNKDAIAELLMAENLKPIEFENMKTSVPSFESCETAGEFVLDIEPYAPNQPTSLILDVKK